MECWADSAFSLCSMYNSGYKSSLWKYSDGPRSLKLGSPMSILSFSLTLFFRLIPWSTGARCVHLSAWTSKTWTGRRFASSLPREIGRAPAAYVNGASPLYWGFIDFVSTKEYQSLSFLYFSSLLIPSISLYISINFSRLAVHIRIPWIQPGLDPGTWWYPAPGEELLSGWCQESPPGYGKHWVSIDGKK